MNKLILRCLVFVSVVATGVGYAQKSNDSIGNQAARIYKNIAVLAHDTLLGREAGTKYEKIAADYIQSLFIEAGLDPLSKEEGYLQQVLIPAGFKANDSLTYLILNKKKYMPEADFYPLLLSDNTKAEGTVIYVGKGIVDRKSVV